LYTDIRRSLVQKGGKKEPQEKSWYPAGCLVLVRKRRGPLKMGWERSTILPRGERRRLQPVPVCSKQEKRGGFRDLSFLRIIPELAHGKKKRGEKAN